MFSHVMLGSNDIARSRKFYDAVLGTLGFTGEPMAREEENGPKALFYMHNGGAFGVTRPIDGKPASSANGGTLGFACSSPEQVNQFHDAGIANGGTSIEDPPGLRQTPGLGPMHLAYLRDPDGNKLCAVYRGA